MNCKEVEYNLIHYLDESLSMEKRNQVQAHISSCPACQKSLHVLQETYLLIEEEKKEDVSPFFVEVLERKLGQQVTMSQHFLFIPWVRRMLVAASIFLIIISGLLAGITFESNLHDEMNLFVSQEIVQVPIESYLLNE